MSDVKRFRRLDVGPVELTVGISKPLADAIAETRLYRALVRLPVRLFARLMRWATVRQRSAAGRSGVRLAGSPAQTPETPEARAIQDAIAGIDWYHTIDLGHGVVTPGWVDHRDQVAHYQLPASLEGMRCLDVATWDGFWAFEMERRGAREVVALDIARWADCDIPQVLLEDARRFDADQPTGAGFNVAHRILGSRVRRELCNVYDLTAQRFGTFDLVLVSDLLLHLRDPQLALERIYSVCRGTTIVADVYQPALEAASDRCLSQFTGAISSQAFFWWRPSTATLRQMMVVAGFEPVEERSRLVLNARFDDPVHKVVLHGLVSDRPSWRPLLQSHAQRARVGASKEVS